MLVYKVCIFLIILGGNTENCISEKKIDEAKEDFLFTPNQKSKIGG
jgi:hypothetical protein